MIFKGHTSCSWLVNFIRSSQCSLGEITIACGALPAFQRGLLLELESKWRNIDGSSAILTKKEKERSEQLWRRLMMDEQQTPATATPSSGPSTLSVSGMASLGLGLTLHQQQDRCDADYRPGPSASSTSSVPSIDGMCNYLFHKIILFCHVFPFLV